MKISELAIRRGVATSMIYALLILLGVVAIFKIPLEFMPRMDMPYMEIHVPYEGASPIEVCDKIVKPIEEAIATLPGIRKIQSRCRPDYAHIGLQLSGDAKMDYMVLDLQERVDQIRKDLPADVRNIMIMKFDTDQFPVIFGALTFLEDRPENNELIDRYVVRPLKTVEGVAEVMVEGLEEQRVLVEIDDNQLTRYGVSVIQVFEVLTAANLTLAAGELNQADTRYSVRLVGEFKSLDEIRDLPLTAAVKVGDVAEVRMDYVKPFFIGRFNQRRAYMLSVLKESGANTVQVCREVNARLEELLQNPQLREVQLKIWFDQSKEITGSLDILVRSGMAGAVLAFLVLWMFLRNFKTTLIISMAIPMSILSTIAVMYFLQMSFNMITLSALIVGIGMLVDNSIVVLEAIDLRHRQGTPPAKAALKGAIEVGLAISVATTTTIIVFLPLIFTEQSQASVLMKQMGIVLALAIGSSLMVSLTLIPLLSSRILTVKARGLPRWYVKVRNAFIATLARGLNHRFISLGLVYLIFMIAVLIFIWPAPWDKMSAFEKFEFSPLIEKEAVPAALMRVVRISVNFEQKPGLDEIDARMRELETMFMAKKGPKEWDLDTVVAIVSPRFNRILLILPFDRRSKYTAREIEDLAREHIRRNIRWPGVTVEIGGEGMGGGPPGMTGGTSIRVRGPDPDQVYEFAEMIRNQLMDVPNLKEISPIEREGQNELHVIVDRNLARQYGFELSQVAMAVSYGIRGVPVGQFLSAETPIDIYMQLREADRQSVAQLESMMIQNLRGEYVPLNNIADFKMVPIPEVVRRDNRLITVRIPIVPEGKDLGEVAKSVSQKLAHFQLPTGYSWALGEEFQERRENLETLAKAMLLAMILVFLVMTAQFESFFLPFVIMFTLPFAMIGVVLALLVSRATFSILSGAGCLLLIGIVVNNAIVLVDHIHNLRKQGLSDTESLLQAASDRLRPIMMTAITTIVGLLPMALGINDTGSMMYSPLAIAVLGGLIISTFLTPFVIPVIYSLSDDLLKWLKQIYRIMARV